ncbi:MAG: hypothetical protein HHJ10_15410 [Cellulomonas sp.]|uniref:cellulose binding domain-containing protein n=1 Tax=Cellulomonas sp. TaxID=40001 RepID=UPI0017AA3DAE|nr:cellulose binding domain-containing protein [Cellulomonas sp.]NMM32382.1 hypothetical protein [Cellulomonas sp.]
MTGSTGPAGGSEGTGRTRRVRLAAFLLVPFMLGARPLLDRLERYFSLDVEIAGVVGEQGDIVQHKIPVALTRTWPDPALDAWADGSASGGLGMWSATPTTDGRSVTAASLSWNAQLAPGASTTFVVTGSTTANPTALTASCGRSS